MKYIICIFILSALMLTAQAQQDWTGYNISGSVKVWFPAIPALMDTMGQQYAYVRDKDEMMMANMAAIPDSILRSDTFSNSKALNNFVNSIIEGSTRLIYSDVAFKGIPSKYYKIRMDDDKSPVYGLVVDGYCLIYKDTIYNFSYWRFRPGELFDYSRQRLFYDKIELRNEESEQVDSLGNDSEGAEVPASGGRNLPAIMLGTVVVILAAALMYQRYQLKKGRGQ